MITTAETYHVPVLLNESIDGLDIKSDVNIYAVRLDVKSVYALVE